MRIPSEITTPLRFVVTIDTEADDAWENPERIAVRNIRALDQFQDLCDRYDIVPTYLLTYECAARDEALKTLRPLADNRRCEIGHHLHVWTTPPFQNKGAGDIDLDWIHAFQFQLPDSLFEEKAECLRRAIEDNFGRSPTSHRAGRWGIDQRTVDWLGSNGFIAETSIRKGLRLTEFLPGIRLVVPPDREIASVNYGLQKNAYIWSSSTMEATSKSVVEIPATVDTPDGSASTLFLRYLSLRWPGERLLFRIYRKLFGLRMLYPDPALPPGALPAIASRSLERGVSILNLMLHSSELSLYCSPFTRSKRELDAVWKHVEELFGYVKSRNITSDSLSGVADLALKSIQAQR